MQNRNEFEKKLLQISGGVSVCFCPGLGQRVARWQSKTEIKSLFGKLISVFQSGFLSWFWVVGGGGKVAKQDRN